MTLGEVIPASEPRCVNWGDRSFDGLEIKEMSFLEF